MLFLVSKSREKRENLSSNTRISNAERLGTDSIGKLLTEYALPAIIAMASSSIYHIIDSIFVGHGVGGAAIAGMAITMPIMNISSAFGAMVGVGAGATISLRLGEGNKMAAEKTLGNAALLNVVIGLVVMVLMLMFLDPILMLFSGGRATEETITYARQFMQIILAGNVITHLYLGMNDMIRASGYPRKSMTIVLTTVAVNLVLNPLFIFKFHWGIRGSAAATVIAQCVAFAIALSHLSSRQNYIHFSRRSLHFEWKIIGAILSIGLAPFLLNLCASLVAAFVNHALLQYGGTGVNDAVRNLDGLGDIYVGSYGIANRVILLFIMIVQGLAQGMQPIVGYNYGAEKFGRVRRTLFITIGCAVGVATLGFALSQLMPERIAQLFVDSGKGGNEQAMITAATQALRIIMLIFPLVGFQIVTGNFFQYIGKAPLAIFTSLTRQMLFLLPLLYFVPRTLGAYGVWISFPIADCASILLAAILLVWQLRDMKRRELGIN